MNIKLQAFSVPTEVYPQSKVVTMGAGFKPVEGYPLEDVDAEELLQMCEDFKVEVFRRAKKEIPK